MISKQQIEVEKKQPCPQSGCANRKLTILFGVKVEALHHKRPSEKSGLF